MWITGCIVWGCIVLIPIIFILYTLYRVIMTSMVVFMQGIHCYFIRKMNIKTMYTSLKHEWRTIFLNIDFELIRNIPDIYKKIMKS